MKKFIVFCVILSSTAFATNLIECKKDNLVVKISSFCPLPSGQEGVRVAIQDETKSLIEVYENNKLISSSAASCNGVNVEDLIIFSTDIQNKDFSFQVVVMDDFGLDFALWLDMSTKANDFDDLLRFEDCKIL